MGFDVLYSENVKMKNNKDNPYCPSIHKTPPKEKTPMIVWIIGVLQQWLSLYIIDDSICLLDWKNVKGRGTVVREIYRPKTSTTYIVTLFLN